MHYIQEKHGTFSSKLKKIQLNADLSKYHSPKTILNVANHIHNTFLIHHNKRTHTATYVSV